MIVLPAIVAALGVLAAQFLLTQTGSLTQLTLWSPDPVPYLIGGAVGGGFFLVMSLASRGAWIGGGDIKLGLLLGTNWCSYTHLMLPMCLRVGCSQRAFCLPKLNLRPY